MYKQARSLTVVVAAVALLAFAVAPAGAHHKDGHDKGGGKAESKSSGGSEQAKSSGGSGEAKSSGGSGKGSGSGKDKGFGYETGAPGNNGTVKIRSTGAKDGDHRNEPHPGCTFWLHFWNFDEPATGTATFRAHPPTGGSRDVLLTDTVQVGDDQLISGPYDLAPIFESLGIAPHPQQGYHVKLTLDSDFSQGARVKHKVFWIDCQPDEEVVGGEEEVDDEVKSDEELKDAQDKDEVKGRVDKASTEEVQGIRFFRAPTVAAEVAGAAAESAAAPAGALPFTGAGMLPFLMLGLAMLGSGIALIRRKS